MNNNFDLQQICAMQRCIEISRTNVSYDHFSLTFGEVDQAEALAFVRNVMAGIKDSQIAYRIDYNISYYLDGAGGIIKVTPETVDRLICSQSRSLIVEMTRN
jgi:hypothetical protein